MEETSHVASEMGAWYVRGAGRGASAARNTSIALARSEVITFLDDDDAWMPGNLAPQVRLLREHPEYVAVVSRFALVDSQLGHPGVPYPRPVLPSRQMLEVLIGHIVVPGAIVARTDAVRAIDGFDETLHSAEDWGFFLCLARHGQVGYAPVLSLLVRSHPEIRSYTMSRGEDVSWRTFHDVLIVFRRHTSDLPLAARIHATRVMVKRRGWFSGRLIGYAEGYARTEVGACDTLLRSRHAHLILPHAPTLPAVVAHGVLSRGT